MSSPTTSIRVSSSVANGREHQQPGDPLRERAVDAHVPAARPPGVDRHRQRLALVLELDAEALQRAQQRPDRAAAEVALADDRDRPVAERGEPDQEVERRAGAADRDLVVARREAGLRR